MPQRTKGTEPFVSVVIPHQGSDEALESCLDAIRRQSYPSNKIETFVVLNEPDERTLSFPLTPGETVLWEPRYFSYAARNTGILHAKGDIIALTDSDTVPHEDWILHGVSAITEGADLVAGQIVLTFSSQRLTPAACYEKLFAFDQEKNVTSGYSTTANLFVRSEVFTTVGLFDEHAHTGEDFAWTRKAIEGGAHLVYSPGTIVAHPAREAMVRLFAKAKRTSSLFVGASIATSDQASMLRGMLRHKLLVGPSSSKRKSMRPAETMLAHAVRALLIAKQLLHVLRGRATLTASEPSQRRPSPAEPKIIEIRAV